MNVERLIKLNGKVTPAATGTEDVFGDDVPADGTPFNVKYWLAQTSRSEQTANADTQAEQFTLYLRREVAGRVDGSATFTDNAGDVYSFDGPPWTATNPRTRQVSHLEATIRKVA